MHYRPVHPQEIDQVVFFVETLSAEGAKMSFVDVDRRTIVGWFQDEDVALFGAFDGGRLVGLVKSQRGARDNQKYWSFLSIAIEQKARKKGLAVRLSEEACDALYDQGIRLVRAYIYSDNPASIATAKAAGFVQTGTVIAHHIDEKTKRPIDDYIFQKDLRRGDQAWI